MAKAYKQEFQLPTPQGTMEHTSLVMDADEFERVVRCLVANGPEASEAQKEQMIRSCLTAGMVPLVTRGTKTQWLFDEYEVRTDRVGLVRRGTARRMGIVPPVNRG